jgi:hypothetical protein
VMSKSTSDAALGSGAHGEDPPVAADLARIEDRKLESSL